MQIGGVAVPPQRGDGHHSPIGGDELARGLMLVRASAIKMARLHVAMESRDRRLVFETMDDLVTLDGQLRDFVERIPRSDDEIDVLQDEIDEERAALAREKLALVGGVSRREERKATERPSQPIDEATPATEAARVDITRVADADVATNTSSEAWLPVRDERTRRDWRSTFMALTFVTLLFAALAGAFLLFGTNEGQAMMDRLLQFSGG